MRILFNLQLRDIHLLICSFYKTQNSFAGFFRDNFWLLFVRQTNSMPHFNVNSPRSFIIPFYIQVSLSGIFFDEFPKNISLMRAM